jgi:uncharacterized RDD family membrane protein YckC
LEDQEIKYAGFWIRVGATIIDGLCLILVTGINIYSVYYLKNLPLAIACNIFVIAYKPFMEKRFGATLGKMALSLKVVSDNGEALTANQVLLRATPWVLNGAVSVLTIITLAQHPSYLEMEGFVELTTLQTSISNKLLQNISSIAMLASVLAVAFSAKKQGLHDLLAKTYCVKTD